MEISKLAILSLIFINLGFMLIFLCMYLKDVRDFKKEIETSEAKIKENTNEAKDDNKITRVFDHHLEMGLQRQININGKVDAQFLYWAEMTNEIKREIIRMGKLNNSYWDPE